jgi:tetratricopeptide (TPR) repeat protein
MRARAPGWGKRIPVCTVVLGAFFLLAFAGCAHTVKQRKQVPEPTIQPLSPKEEAEFDQRIDGLAHYAVGISDELNSRQKEATDEFLKAALADLHEEGLLLEVARRLIREQRNQEAIDLLKKASVQPDPPSSTFALLGLAYIQDGQTNLAVQANQQSILKAPDNLAGYQNLSALELQAGKTNEAVAVIERAAGRTNAPPEFLLGVADLLTRYARQQLLSDAESKQKILRALDAAAAQNSDNPLITQRIADLYLLHGSSERAEPLYEALLARFPNIPGLREKLANIYIRTDKKAKATKLLEEIKKENPTDPSTYFFIGSLAYEAKDYDKAAESYQTALKLNPDLEPLYYDLAGVQIARHQPEEALSLLKTARGKFKLNFILEFYTGIAEGVMNNWSEALSHLTSAELIAKTTDPTRLNHIFYYQLGEAYERSGNIPDAIKALRKALELSPDYAEALNYLGYMWADRGENLEEAHSMLERAVKLEPENAAILDSFAWVLFKLGKASDALVPMDKAIRLSRKTEQKDDPTLLEHLGDIQAALKEFDKARDAYSKSLAAKPDDKVKQKLDLLLPR